MVTYMPSSMLAKMVTRTPAKKMTTSIGETRQNWYTVLGAVIRSPTAWMMTAESVALGIY